MSHRWRPFVVMEATENASGTEGKVRPRRQPGQTWRDHLVMLLEIAAEIEHGLMVQYLYAAYSLGGPEVDTPERRALTEDWRRGILRVATEEMGHFITVQNILHLLGAPLNLERDDYPYDMPYYPFPFMLEPLSRASLACYIHAEMPPDVLALLAKHEPLPRPLRDFVEADKAEIERLVHARIPGPLPPVATVYDEILELIADESRVPDSAFNEESYAEQANWDDWGRHHGPAPRLVDVSGSAIEVPRHQKQSNVLVLRAATRTQAIAALEAIAGQGEAPHLDPKDGLEPSHFERFLHIFQAFPKDWTPARDIPVNPSTRRDKSGAHAYIAEPASRNWAALFNLRYRMLLTYLAQSYRLARRERPGAPSRRAMAMHRVFGEMYQLKTLAGIVMRQPLTPRAHSGSGAKFAGPPFEMPYSLHLPESDADAWMVSRQLHEGAIEIGAGLLPEARGEGADYLRAMLELDRAAISWIEAMAPDPRPALGRRA